MLSVCVCVCARARTHAHAHVCVFELVQCVPVPGPQDEVVYPQTHQIPTPETKFLSDRATVGSKQVASGSNRGVGTTHPALEECLSFLSP